MFDQSRYPELLAAMERHLATLSRVRADMAPAVREADALALAQAEATIAYHETHPHEDECAATRAGRKAVTARFMIATLNAAYGLDMGDR